MEPDLSTFVLNDQAHFLLPLGEVIMRESKYTWRYIIAVYRERINFMKRNKLLIAMAAFALLLATLACAAGGPPAITDVVTAQSLDENYKPVNPTSSYQPEDVVSLSVHVENLVVGSTVKVEYKLNGEPYEESSLAADEAGSGYYGFTLTPTEYGHMPGNYTADVYLLHEWRRSCEQTFNSNIFPLSLFWGVWGLMSCMFFMMCFFKCLTNKNC